MRKGPVIEGSLDGLLSGFLRAKRCDEAKPYLGQCARVLDIGCGIYPWRSLLPPRAEYVGIDIQEAIIRHNRQHVPHEFHRVNIETSGLSFLRPGFDLVLILAVIEHLADPAECLRKVRKVLAPGGVIVLTTPHPSGRVILGTGSILGLLARDKHEHHDLLNRRDIERIARESDLTLTSYRRFLLGLNQVAVLRKDDSASPPGAGSEKP